MKANKLLVGRLYRSSYQFREGEYVYVGERLIGHCFQGCDGNRNMAMSEDLVDKYIHEIE